MNSKNNLNSIVDIIVPNYNKAPFINQCIESVIHQSYKNWRLFIIDDASNDNSRKILSNYKKIKNINIIFLKKNKGPYFCRNLALRISSSEFVSFLDSDDYWTKTKLFDQMTFMIDNDYDFTFTDYISFFQNNELNKKKTNILNQFNYKQFLNNSSINSSTMILKRKVIGTLKFKNLIHEDYLFKCEILKKGILAHKVNKELAFYRIIKSSRSANKIKNILSLWYINKHFNNLNTLENLKSLFLISLNSLKKYGFK